MADILIDAQSVPSTPAAGKGVIYVDSTSKKLSLRDDGGTVKGTLSNNFSSGASQASFTVDTYITGSGILIPSCGMQAGQLYMHRLWISKTAAGTGAPVYTWRIGSAQTTADTSRATVTSAAQTGVVDAGLFTFVCLVRSVGASGQIVASYSIMGKRAADAVGFGTAAMSTVAATFDNTALAGLYLGLSINPTATGTPVWTIDQSYAELVS